MSGEGKIKGHYIEQTGVQFYEERIDNTIRYTVEVPHLLEVFLNPIKDINNENIHNL